MILAPIASNPFKCRSIGREPIAQPPGIATFACLTRAKSGPKTTIEARIFETYLNGASYDSSSVESTVISF